MKSVDPYYKRRYHVRDYNCVHLVCEVWKDYTGEDISDRLGGALTNRANRTMKDIHLRRFRRITELVDPCIVLAFAARSAPHMGIHLRGRILHIGPVGVRFELPEVALFGYTTRKFYVCR